MQKLIDIYERFEYPIVNEMVTFFGGISNMKDFLQQHLGKHIDFQKIRVSQTLIGSKKDLLDNVSASLLKITLGTRMILVLRSASGNIEYVYEPNSHTMQDSTGDVQFAANIGKYLMSSNIKTVDIVVVPSSASIKDKRYDDQAMSVKFDNAEFSKEFLKWKKRFKEFLSAIDNSLIWNSHDDIKQYYTVLKKDYELLLRTKFKECRDSLDDWKNIYGDDGELWDYTEDFLGAIELDDEENTKSVFLELNELMQLYI